MAESVALGYQAYFGGAAQLFITPAIQADFEEGELEDTDRGAGGVGSTGK